MYLDEIIFHFPNHQMTRTTDEGGGLEAKKIEKCQLDKLLYYVDIERRTKIVWSYELYKSIPCKFRNQMYLWH